MDLLIRDARPEDRDVIVDFNARLAQESEGKTLDLDVLARGVTGALAHPELCRYFVAEHAGEIVGQLMITYEWTDWRDGVLWWLQSVYVSAPWRRRGVFGRLLAHATDLARSDPRARGLRLYVETHNTAARETYARLGFVPSGHLVLEQDWSLNSRML